MTLQGLSEIRQKYLIENWEYQCIYYTDFNYKILENCIYKKSHKWAKTSYNDITIMIDTETSKAEIEESFNDYDEAVELILNTKLKWSDTFKEIATKSELRQFGVDMSGNYPVDVFYENLVNDYPYLFNECYSDFDCLYEIFYFMQNHLPEEPIKDNHIVIWTMSIALFDIPLATLYGRKPSELIECITKILDVLSGDKTYMYIFNLSYDYVFLRKFLNRDFGYPVKQLNVKPHYPISIEYENGLILKDALILAQRKLEKWARDLNVKHQKAVGDWDYRKFRHQDSAVSKEELHYAEFDTLSGIECIDTLKNQLGKDIGTMPWTSTGILREQIKKEGSKNKAREWFLKLAASWPQYQKQVKLYHGGFTHGNRNYIGHIFKESNEGLVIGADFASSYPYVLFFKYPAEKFLSIQNKSIDFIIKNSEKYAFMFKLIGVQVELKQNTFPMPFLQYSKVEKLINPVVDNGRILACDYIEIYLNDIDLKIIESQYKFKKSICVEVEAARKNYLPRWFTDIVFNLFKDKTQLKGHDEVLYTIQKYKLNACYGLCCQRLDKPELIETEDGEYIESTEKTPEDIFNETIKRRSTILPYVIGCYCTSYAAENLFKLGSMCDEWLYSDTDSCYALGWHMKEVEKYNQECINFMIERGYGGVEHEGRMYYLGVAEFEDKAVYTEFCYYGAKRYCGRSKKDNELHITVAGVPKEKGAKCLNNDIRNFKDGFTFKGHITGKLTHTHLYVDDIYINDFGDEVGDSIDLTECDYKLSSIQYHSIEEYIASEEEIYIDIAQDIDDMNLII